jgi:hypothetical protein
VTVVEAPAGPSVEQLANHLVTAILRHDADANVEDVRRAVGFASCSIDGAAGVSTTAAAPRRPPARVGAPVTASAGGAPSLASARREPLRVDRELGVVSAGLSALVRGATIVREV